ncbi:hypothetical protein ACVWZ6_000063 [Bradyrhizobium sp. GM6.1]
MSRSAFQKCPVPPDLALTNLKASVHHLSLIAVSTNDYAAQLLNAVEQVKDFV